MRRPLFEYEGRWAPRGACPVFIEAPDLACLSWIPFYESREDLGPCPLKENWDTEPAIPLMLKHGNVPPIEQFDDDAQFLRLLLLREFRAAVAIVRPRLFLDANRQITGVDFLYLHEVGYTPLRKGPATFHFPGKADRHRSAQLRSGTATIDFSMGFKLGRIADAVGKYKTGHWAPSPSVRFRYTIAGSGLITIEVSASHVPSHSVYVDWVRRREYHMEKEGTMESFCGFLESGFCVTAPTFGVYRTEERCDVRENPVV